MKHLTYPNLLTPDGVVEGRRLPTLTAAERETVAAEHFGGFLAGGTVVPIPMPAGLDRDNCGFYCNGAVRYVEAYCVAEDALLGRMDLALDDGG